MSITTNHVWNDDNVLAETDGANTTTTLYSYEPAGLGNLLSTRMGSTTRYHGFDAPSSTRLLTNANGHDTDTFNYDAWGKLIVQSGLTDVHCQWKGEFGYYFDPETETHYVRARIYHPNNGSWSSTDPLRMDFGTNYYIYVRNCPVRLVDASGLECEDSKSLQFKAGSVETDFVTATIEADKCGAGCADTADYTIEAISSAWKSRKCDRSVEQWILSHQINNSTWSLNRYESPCASLKGGKPDFVGLPGELEPEYGKDKNKNSFAKFTFICQLVCTGSCSRCLFPPAHQDRTGVDHDCQSGGKQSSWLYLLIGSSSGNEVIDVTWGIRWPVSDMPPWTICQPCKTGNASIKLSQKTKTAGPKKNSEEYETFSRVSRGAN